MKLDVLANDIFVRTNEWGGQLRGMLSEEMDDPYPIPAEYPRGKISPVVLIRCSMAPPTSM